ncbi:hypothetical protein [Saccharibacillus sacchari]|uniref:Uncharacterized protein n=1 Tax=Saccharibacillus sacchari TaxID=456493 RepID=A0ACC6PDK1_9BACL
MEDLKSEQIAAKVNKRKRATAAEMIEVILELCQIKALDIRTIAVLINRGEATTYNHYVMKLVREKRLARIYNKENSLWVYSVNKEEI